MDGGVRRLQPKPARATRMAHDAGYVVFATLTMARSRLSRAIAFGAPDPHSVSASPIYLSPSKGERKGVALAIGLSSPPSIGGEVAREARRSGGSNLIFDGPAHLSLRVANSPRRRLTRFERCA